MQIELLYFEGCPSWQEALALEGIQAEICLTCVTDNDHAAAVRFLGSPSFRVNGVDLWPEERKGYNLSCRVYATPHGMKGAPTVAMLREALQQLNTTDQT